MLLIRFFICLESSDLDFDTKLQYRHNFLTNKESECISFKINSFCFLYFIHNLITSNKIIIYKIIKINTLKVLIHLVVYTKSIKGSIMLLFYIF